MVRLTPIRGILPVLVAVACLEGRAADWPGFRGSTGQGLAVGEKPPVEWSATSGMAWKASLPGPGASGPVVAMDRVYITCYSGYFVPGMPGGKVADLKRHLLCLDAASGKTIWEKSVPAKLPEEEKIRDHGYAASTPLVDDKHVYAFFGKTGVLAFHHDGSPAWTADVGSGTSGWGSAASPVALGDLIIINASVESGSVIALDRQTGKEKWRAGGIKESWNTPVVIPDGKGGKQVVVAIAGKVLALEPETGKTAWSCATDIRWYMVPSLVHADGLVGCVGGRSGIASLAVKTGGAGDITASNRLWTSQKGSNVSSPILHEGHMYWMNDQQGVAYCAKAATGEIAYEERIPGAGQVYASPVLAGGNIYYLSRGGKTFVVSATPKFQLVASNSLQDGGGFNGSPAVSGNRLFIRSDKFLYCLGK